MAFHSKKSLSIKKAITLFLLFTLLNQIFAPTIAYALTAGPTAPEATNFEPVDTTDMVNPLTGDFTYSLPLLEVPGPEGGYPLSLSYHAAIQPNEDASWVGLGWSLNPGAISRNVNGFPDDWNGDNLLTMHRVWPGGVTKTTSFNIGVNLPVSGDYMSVNFGLSFAQDTYRGFGVGYSVGAGVGLGKDSPFGVYGNIGVGPYGGVYAGLGLDYSFDIAKSGLNGSASIGVSTNFKSISANGSGGISVAGGGSLGASISTSQSAQYSVRLGLGTVNSVNNANEGKIQSTTESWGVSASLFVVSLGVSYNQQTYWSNVTDNSAGFGVLYNHASIANVNDYNAVDDDNYNIIDINHNNIVDNPDVDTQIGGTFPNFDDYSVTAQGLGGYMRPYVFSTVLYKQNRINSTDHSNDVVAEVRNTSGITRTNWKFRFMNDFSNSYRQGSPWSDTNYDFDPAPQYGNNDGNYGYDPTTNRLEGSRHIEYFTNDEINDLSATSKARQMGFINCDAGGFVRGPGHQIGGFMITNASGVTYHYALPAYNTGEGILTQKIGSNGADYNTLNKVGSYAYTWYLTAITGPDYVSRGATPGQLDKSDWGYWVKFDYGKWTNNYTWANPAQGYIVNVDNNFESSSLGNKELYYLDAIETRSHTAIFEKEIRADGKSLNPGDIGAIGPNQESGYNLFPGQLCSNVQPHGGCAFGPSYPTPTLRLKDILLFQNDQLNMSVASLRANGHGYNGQYDYAATVPNQDGSITQVHRNVFYGDNVIDTYDIAGTSPNIVGNCLRKIVFNYDYSLSPNTVNSSNISYPTTVSNPNVNTPVNPNYTWPPLLGKLTLLSVDFQGKGGTPVTPPVEFGYDLDPADPGNQGNISISQPSGLNGSITQSGTKFSVGDILTFTQGGQKYYCTLLSTQDNLTFNVLYLNNVPSAAVSGISAIRTKNPPYNKDAYDAWGCYKSDYIPLTPNNENLSRMTSPVSNKSTDVWSLRTIVSGTGATIHINYEGDTYNRSVLNKSKSIIASSGSYDANAKTLVMNLLNPTNLDLTQLYAVGNKIEGVLLFQETIQTSPNTADHPYFIAPISSYPNCIIQSIAGNTIKVSVDASLVNALSNTPVFTTGNIASNNKVNYGGGLRVRDLIVDDLNGQINKTSYDYGLPGAIDPSSSSGVTSYEPTVFDADQAPGGTDVNGNDALKSYRKVLYSASSNLLQISHVVPAPGIAYEYVTVNQSIILPSGQTVPVKGKTRYQYEVFKPEMLGIKSYSYTSTPVNANTSINGNPNTFVVNQLRQNLAIKDYTSRVGNLKRIITYDNLGNKLTEKINHYLHDDLANTSFQNQINNYEPRLSSYGGVAYNYMGVVDERYGNSRLVTVGVDKNKNATQYNDLLVMSNKETFPSIQTGVTQIDYKNGTHMDQSNLAYDYYTGTITKALTTDSYGNRFINQVTPAYMAGNGVTYPTLGLKTHDDNPGAVQHKQMLTQQASNYTFTVDNNNTPIGVVTASAQTWSNSIPVLDPDENATTVGQSNIWRMEKSLSWMPDGSSGNNLTPYASFVDYFASGGSSNTSWKKTSQTTQYNVYSAALEANDINNNYAATRMGYNDSKVVMTGTPVHYYEIANAGAEDALLSNGNFSNNISKGSGTIVTDSTSAHTGMKSLRVAAGANGFSYSVPVSRLNPAQSYQVAVWVKPVSGTSFNQAQLYYTANGSTITPTQTYAKTAGNWCLLEITVPSTAITGTTLVVGCKNAAAVDMYFDDFRFQPTAAATTSYVYDNTTGELTYMLDNHNLFTRYQYDAAGRLVRVYKEVIGKGNTPLIKGIVYNYGRMPSTCVIPPLISPLPTSSSGTGSFVTPDPMDKEWSMDAPAGYTLADDDGTTINAGKRAGLNAGRFVYFATAGTVTPFSPVSGTLSFSAKGTGTIEIQLISTSNNSIQARKSFTLTAGFQNYTWAISNLYPQTEMVAAIVVNGGNSSPQATVQFQKNFNLNLSQLALSGTYTRFRADATSLIGNAEKDWYGWSDQYNAPRKKYLQHSAYARMRFQTTATHIAIEYVRDFYDKRVVNLFPVTQVQNNKVWDANGNVVDGTGAVNTATQVTGGQTYTISGLLTTNPTIVWYKNGAPLGAPIALTNSAPAGQPPVYQVIAPATATSLGIFIQNANDTFNAYANCMVQQGAIGTVTPLDGTIPSAFTPFSGYIPSHISGPAIFINGILYKYYQVEGNDVAKVVQFVADDLPAGDKTVEVMMPGQGTYLPADPHTRRAGTYLRAVYFPGTTTTVFPSTTVKPGSIVYIHDSILSGFNISSDAQNNVWMMKVLRDPSYGFTGDVFSEGYAGRLLYTDVATPELTKAFAGKLASYGVDKYWFQIGVNDFGFNTPLPVFYRQYKSLIEQLKALRPNVKIYIQSTGPEIFEGANKETMADDGLVTTGPAANDFRDVQRALANSHAYCEYVDFENLFPAVIDNLADGIHPTDAGNVLYANGIKNKSTLLGTVLPVLPLAFYRSTTRNMVQSVSGIYTITAKGGKAPYTFSKVSGDLPQGLTFNSDGTITGTPLTGGNFPISVNVTDANNTSVTQTFTVGVDLLPGIVVGPAHIINGQVGAAYSKVFHGYYGYGPYTFAITSGDIPAGMAFDGITGTLSGSPLKTGSTNFTITATDHWGFSGNTDYTLITGTTTPIGLTDTYSVSAAVDGSNHLILRGHLNDIYPQTLFAYIGAYYTPPGSVEEFLSGALVNVPAGSKDGPATDMGAMGLLPGSFSVRMQNGAISPTVLDGVQIGYNVFTTQSLTTNVTSPKEQLGVNASINSAGHLIITASLPSAPSLNIYTSIGAIVTQNGKSTFVSGPSVVINANSLSSGGVDFGLLPVSAGSVGIQVTIGALSPSSIDGKVITYNSNTNFNLTMPSL